MAKPPRRKHSPSSAKPVTIDLEPEPVAFDASAGAPTEDAADDTAPVAEAPASDSTAPGDTQPASDRFQVPPQATGGGRGSAVTGGVIGGVLALLIAAGGQWIGLIPSPGSSEPAVSQEDFAALTSRVDAIAAQPADGGLGETVSVLRSDLDALSQRTDGLAGELSELADRPVVPPANEAALAQMQERIEALQTQLAGLATGQPAAGSDAAPGPGADALAVRIDDLEASVQDLADRLAEATAQTTAAGEVAADLQARVGEMETAVAGLSQRPDAALPIAAAALKSAIDRGGSFAKELEVYAGVTGDTATVDALREFAAAGVPTHDDLRQAFPAAANAMLDAVRKPQTDAGLMDRLMTSAKGLVRVRPVGEVEGEGPEAIVARIEARLKAGDLAAALAELETLPPAARDAGAGWEGRLRSRLTSDRLVDEKLNAILTGG